LDSRHFEKIGEKKGKGKKGGYDPVPSLQPRKASMVARKKKKGKGRGRRAHSYSIDLCPGKGGGGGALINLFLVKQ